MNDPEFVKLRNRFSMGIIICLILVIPIFLFFYKRVYSSDTNLMKKIKREETMFILVTKKDCRECQKWEEKLKEKIAYSKINRDKDSNYPRILEQLDLEKEDVAPPALLYIKEGQLVAMVMEDMTPEEVVQFVDM